MTYLGNKWITGYISMATTESRPIPQRKARMESRVCRMFEVS
jgi:hypothetical protein